MTTVNPLQSALQNAYSQLNNQVQSNRPGQVEADVMRFFGAPASLLQDLRNDLKAVTDGPNPHRAVDNLLTGLQKLEMFTAGPSIATEMPAGREPSIGDKFFVKGENGEPKEVPMAKEMPAGREPSVGDKFFVKGENGEPKEVPMAKEMPAGREPSVGDKFFVKGENGEPKEIPLAKEMPAGREPSVGDKFFVKGENGEPKEVPLAKEMPAGREPSIGDKFFVKGENGEPKEITPAREMPAGREPSVGDKFFVKGADGQPEEILLDAKADNVILSLKKLLDANATGTDIQQAVATLSSTLQGLTGAIANDSEKLKAALLNSIRSQS
ncbi:hypothetical protein SAMN05216475_5396 [Pseudomonas synxantha]|uniref:Uncharacterized protein n=5 Tax=Pseudomonas synxantha TaxID=47883 RepID=A0AAX3IFD4_9PSED|nr:hypothetical protein [Pseudomonas synxantha]AZE69741.1 hypothetical protein C4K01_5594 [Pseudomonas synxantha]SDU61958.1 hypothetical protein SAMN05216475_5396 [Pseudomonas synxantha]VTR05546.1 Uncharacterised protein [Pseudomonas synxantha]